MSKQDTHQEVATVAVDWKFGGLNTTFISKGSVLAIKDQTLHLLGGEVPLLLGLDTTFITKGSVIVNAARHYIFWKEIVLLDCSLLIPSLCLIHTT